MTNVSRVLARKTSRHGTTYERIGKGAAKATYWRCGRGYMVRATMDGGKKYRFYFKQSRAAAVYECGNYIDADQNGQYIVDNDHAVLYPLAD